MATRLLERYLFVKSHTGWTYKDYDEAAASDIWLDGELAKVEAALIETAKETARHG